MEVGFVFTIAILVCFFSAANKWKTSRYDNLRTPVWRLAEFLVCSIFAQVPIPRRGAVSAVLLLIWTLLMQVPACGFRAVLTSCLNEPPRKEPISGLMKLSGRLGGYGDRMLLCVEETNYANAIEVISRGKSVSIIPSTTEGEYEVFAK